MVNEFINFCCFARNLCETTCANYRAHIGLFNDYCVAHAIKLENATQMDVINFMAEKRRQGVRASSINQYVVAISAFYDFAHRFKGFTTNPAAGIQKMKTEQLAPVCIPTHIMRLIIDRLPSRTFQEVRSRLVVLLGYHCGLRRREMLELSVSDIDFASGVLRVFGKGRKVRLVPMSVQVVECLRHYLDLRPLMARVDTRLLVTVNGDPLSYENIAVIVKHALANFVAPELCHCHILRHSFATACMAAGVPIESIATLMGHASVETTMRYLTISPERVRSQIQGVF